MSRDFLKKIKKISFKQWLLLSVSIFWLSCLSGLVGGTGLYQMFVLKQKCVVLAEKANNLETELAQRKEYLFSLRSNAELQELAVRENLDWAKPNEIIFRFTEQSLVDDSTARSVAEAH